jgi:SAM-dependent methyltransferase
MNTTYNPKQYWEERLSSLFNLRGVGHIGFTERYNVWLYKRKRCCIESCFRGASLKGKDVLDIGCGTGFFVEWYLEKGANVCGIDITETSIQELKRQYDCDFYTQDISAADWNLSRKFDIVNMWDVIYHIASPDELLRAFNNIRNNLKVGGLLLFTDWFGLAGDRRIADHVQARCLNTYEQVLPGMGLQLVDTYPLYKLLNQNNLGRLDEHLGWLYWVLDNFAKEISNDNISLAVWQLRQG